MPKKPIKMKTKLQPASAPGEAASAASGKTKAKKKYVSKTYKLTEEDAQRLDQLVKDMNEVSNFKIKEVTAIKGLIFIGHKMKNKERISKAYKDSL